MILLRFLTCILNQKRCDFQNLCFIWNIHPHVGIFVGKCCVIFHQWELYHYFSEMLTDIYLNIYASQLPFWWSRVAGFCWGYWHGRVFSSIFRERSWYCHADVECPTCSCYRDFATCFPCRIEAGPRMMRTKRNKLHMQAGSQMPQAVHGSSSQGMSNMSYWFLQPMIHRDLHPTHVYTATDQRQCQYNLSHRHVSLGRGAGWGGTAADRWYVVTSLNLWWSSDQFVVLDGG